MKTFFRMKVSFLFLCLFGYAQFIVGNFLIAPNELLTLHHHGGHDVNYYTNTWYFYSPENTEKIIESISIQGFTNLEQVEGVPNVYKVRKADHPENNDHHSNDITRTLEDYKQVIWVKQGFTRNLHKRGPIDAHSRYERYFNDELWSLQWYEQDYRSDNDSPRLNMNLVPVYNELKYTGKGVRVAVIDDGLEHTHDDIKDNYDKDISINLNWNKTDPMPRYGEFLENNHGTRCAGEIAMAANNNKCGVGVAYNAKVGGIVLLDGKTNDELEARALIHALKLVHIYNGSWGPKDNGMLVDGPGPIGQLAFHIGATMGRGGKGAIYVFASGNGRLLYDNCAADGYVGSIYSLVIGSATHEGKAPLYAERCAAVIATAYSGGLIDDIKVVTSDINNTCTTRHTGTSAAAPLASGIVALALEANEELTWRDVHHLLVRNCEIEPLSKNEGWKVNAAGFHFNPQFGFGLINAYSLVKEAMSWKNVPEKTICAVEFLIHDNFDNFGGGKSFVKSTKSDGCNGNVKYLEHVQLSISIQYPIRGLIEVDLMSPNGTLCKMMESRPLDVSNEGFIEWKIKSLQFWGENPLGEWTVFVKDEIPFEGLKLVGQVEKVTLILHGTLDYPYNVNK
ncbi:neuroendocrine convertase 1-like isoform X1 [Adelges cooleyi]|uniref:neuroendocrine convertase 1-like isoform X1 n=1 Tax=Adelges cooleyi TaxID=133065 RepID=UPI00217F260A|nr:neuroendocrine convertase 1-like isoform X1 [Adelges cooleyi]